MKRKNKVTIVAAIVLVAAWLATFGAFAQEIAENKIDKHTGAHRVSTSAERLFQKGLSTTCLFSIFATENAAYLKLHFSGTQIFSIVKGNAASLIFSDGSRVELRAMSSEMADYNGSLYKATFGFATSDDMYLKSLEGKTLQSLRVYFTRGYEDFEIKEKNGSAIGRAVSMVNEIYKR